MFSKPAKTLPQLEAELEQVNKILGNHKGVVDSYKDKVIMPHYMTHSMTRNYEKKRVALETEIAERKAAAPAVKSTP